MSSILKYGYLVHLLIKIQTKINSKFIEIWVSIIEYLARFFI